MKSESILIVRVDMRRLKHYREKPDPYMKTPKNLEAIYNKAQALDFEGSIMSFVIDHVKETGSAYNVFFEGQAFNLDKRNLKDSYGQRWFRYNDTFEFRLCETAQQAWKALRGYYFELHEQVKKAREGTPIGDWEPHDSD